MTRVARHYTLIYFMNTAPPYLCYFCAQGLDENDVVIHHINHNETDDQVSNLTAAHAFCHTSYHSKVNWMAGKMKPFAGPHREESKAQISASGRGKVRTPEMKEKYRQAQVGRAPMTEETRRKRSEAQKERHLRNPRSAEESKAISDRMKEYHKNNPITEETRRKQSEAQKAFHQRRREANP